MADNVCASASIPFIIAYQLPTNLRISPMTSISYVKQQRITRLCVRCGLSLCSMALSLPWWWTYPNAGACIGMNSVECSLNFNAITLTTICDERCITTTRDTINQSINVNLLVQIQQIVNKTEATIDNNELIDRTTLRLMSWIKRYIQHG